MVHASISVRREPISKESASVRTSSDLLRAFAHEAESLPNSTEIIEAALASSGILTRQRKAKQATVTFLEWINSFIKK
jgi:hypothetical protein